MKTICTLGLVVSALSLGCSSDENKGAPAPSSPDGSSSDASRSHEASTPTPEAGRSDASRTDGSRGDGAAPVVLTSVVDLHDGKVQGDVVGGTRRFRGIPYAKPPVGELRWKPPAAVTPWTDVLAALDFKSECAQPQWIQGPESDTEDCLYLNVWTLNQAPSAPLPLMVWLPGGGNQNGGASDNSPLIAGGLLYDGRDLSESGN